MKIESRRKALVYLIAVFLVGVVMGGAGGFTYGLCMKLHLPKPEQFEADIARKLGSRLKLTTEQQRAVRPIIHDAVQETTDAWKEAGEQTKAAFLKGQQRMDPLLDERQRAELAKGLQKAFGKKPTEEVGEATVHTNR